MASRVEIILGARDESAGALNTFGSGVRRTFSQAAQDTGVLDQALGGLGGTLRLAGLAFGAFETVSYAKDAVMLAARYETLGTTLTQLGQNAGYTKAYLDQQEEALRKSGITAIGSRESLARMVQANLDLGKSAQLARVAQDAAAVSGLNSSEAYKHLVYGIQSAQVEMLRTVGLNVNLENSYAAAAKQLGRTVDTLSEAEKAQIRLNAVLEAGKGITGSYEAAMGTAGKQVLSFQRYAEDLQVELGKAFGPALSSIVSQAAESIGSLTKSVTESAQSGALLSVGKGLEWIAEHSTIVVTALMGVAAVMAAVKAEAWLLDGGLGKLAQTIDKTVRTAGTGLASAFSLHPLITAASVIMAVATAVTYLADSLGLTDDAMRRQAESAARTTREYSTLRDVVDGVAGPIQQYQTAVAKAHGDQQKQLEALKGLNAVFPELTGEYNSAAEGLANVNANLERFLALKRAELELLRDKAEKEQAERLANLTRLYAELATQMERSRNSMQAAFQRNQAAALGQVWQEDKKWADAMRSLYIEAGKVATAKGVSPELRDSALDLQTKASLATQAVVGLKEALRLLGLTAKEVPASLDGVSLSVVHKLTAGETKAIGDIEKWQREAQNASLHPLRAKIDEINQAVKEGTAGIWANVGDNTELGLVAQGAINQWGQAQRAALAPEMARTKSEWARGYYEIGQTTRDQLLANLQAEAGVLAAGGERTRAQYLQTQKQISDLTLQGYRERQAITEASFSLGRAGEGALIAAYQAELAILPTLKMTAEERAKRELELDAKIRDTKEQGFGRELDLEKTRVSWMAEGTAKNLAQLTVQETDERHHLEVLFAANQDLRDRKKQLLDEYEAYAQRRRQEAAAKERQQVLDLKIQTAKLYGDTRLAKELELEKYAESLKTSGVNQLYWEQLIANKRVELNRTGLEQLLLDWSHFYEGWDKIGENAFTGIQTDLAGAFKESFEGTTTLWEGMWSSMKNIAYQAMAAIATRLATYGLGQLAVSLMPSLSGALGAGGATGTTSSALSLASSAKGAYDLYNLVQGGGLSSIGTYGGLGSSLFNWGEVAPVGATSLGEGSLAITGLSGLGYGVTGVGGALSGWQLAQMLYGSGTGSQIGGAVGGAGGAIGGAMLGQALIPIPGVGALIGAFAGGLLGGAGGGGLGSLFDSEDKRLPYEIPGNTLAHWQELNSRVTDYGQALKDGKISQAEFNDEVYKMAPLAAGAGDYLGGYGSIIGGTLDHLKGLTEGTQEYVDLVNNELNPAWIISTGLAQNLAAGMDQLDAHKKALSDAIDSLAASSSLSADQQSQLIDLIINESGSVADLTDKYNRYNEIKQQLMNASGMERSQVEALGAELRDLHDQLGITGDPMTNLNQTVGTLNESMQSLEQTMRAIFNLPSSKSFDFYYNQHGDMPSASEYHAGGLVGMSLAANLITRHGGGQVPLYAHGGLYVGLPPRRPGEVDIRALTGEWVMQRSAVDYYGSDFMEDINLRRLRPALASNLQAVASAQAPARAASSTGSPAINLHFDFSGASFGSNPQETADLVGQVVESKVRGLLADMGERGENPVVAHSMAVTR